jgi:lipopolysaccharide transport system ATP-binding protein
LITGGLQIVSNIAIRVEGLSKRYRIGSHQNGRYSYQSLRDTLVKAVTTPFRRMSSVLQGQSSQIAEETIWALRDVSFEIKQGEVVGIIGPNGAGKTTLLKVLSRITDPTEGWAELYGRVGSLLEVGTGFHPELTGRENIMLNGAILGMKQVEVDQEFDEIVEFSGVEKFIDTPVKHYSSGMYVRLAFAVAAHMETEILLVDEVLSVGDAAFQKKCLGKMNDVASAGRTILFVSHNLGAVNSLCDRGILLDNGSVEFDGSAERALSAYRGTLDSRLVAQRSVEDLPRRHSSDLARLTEVELLDRRGDPTTAYAYGDTLRVRLVFHLDRPLRVAAEVFLKTPGGESITSFASSHFQGRIFEAVCGDNEVELTVPALPLARGQYSLDIGISVPKMQWLDYVESAAHFDVEYSDPGGIGYDFRLSRGFGPVYVEHYWTQRNSVE